MNLFEKYISIIEAEQEQAHSFELKPVPFRPISDPQRIDNDDEDGPPSGPPPGAPKNGHWSCWGFTDCDAGYHYTIYNDALGGYVVWDTQGRVIGMIFTTGPYAGMSFGVPGFPEGSRNETRMYSSNFPASIRRMISTMFDNQRYHPPLESDPETTRGRLGRQFNPDAVRRFQADILDEARQDSVRDTIDPEALDARSRLHFRRNRQVTPTPEDDLRDFDVAPRDGADEDDTFDDFGPPRWDTPIDGTSLWDIFWNTNQGWWPWW